MFIIFYWKMWMTIFLLFILSHGIFATSGTSDQPHTQIYDQWRANTFKQTLFLPDTYLPFTTKPMSRDIACQKLSDDQTILRPQYIALLTQAGITCTGDWCKNGQFDCSGINPNCYQVEHIIDKITDDPELQGHDVNIVGNLIMAYGLWNSQIGRLTWDNVQNEKSEIYTKFLFESARHFVLTCDAPYIDLDTSNLVGIVLGSFVLIMMVVAIISIACIKSKPPSSSENVEETL